MTKLDVIILAGAPAGPELNPTDENASRAMIDLCGKTMLQWVVDALRKASCVGRICAVGNVSANGLDMVIYPGADMVTNIKLGVDALETEDTVLIVSSDIPLLTPESVDDFVEKALKLGVGFAYPIVTKDASEAKFPGIARTYLKTADGIFTGGNIMLVTPEFIEQNWEAVTKAYVARKHVFVLARMIGMGVLLRSIIAQFIPSVLTVAMLENAISQMLGAKVQSVVSEYPEIGEDVDKPSDLEAVCKFLA